MPVCAAICFLWEAYVTANRETYELTEGRTADNCRAGEQPCLRDLQTGEVSTILENDDGYDLYGVWEDIAAFRMLEMAEDAPELKTGLRSSRKEHLGTSMTGSSSGFVF